MGLSLQKGQSLSLTKKNGDSLTNVRLGLGWDSAVPAKKGFFGGTKTVEIDLQNCCRSLRAATEGRPGDRSGGRPYRPDLRFPMPIATSFVEVLQPPVESAQSAITHMIDISTKRSIIFACCRRQLMMSRPERLIRPVS